MPGALLILANDNIRTKAKHWIDIAPDKTRVTFQETKRSLPQNARLHAMITDIAKQKLYHGIRLSVKDWKLVFLDALDGEVRIVLNLAGTGFVNLGRSTSDLSVKDCGDMMEILSAWGAANGVVFQDVEPTLSPGQVG